MYVLAGITIRRPTSMKEQNSTQMAQNRVLSGGNSRDYFGSNKRVWPLEYKNLNVTDYTTIYNIYLAYLANKVPVTWVVGEGNYAITATVMIDFPERDFSIPGSTYLSDNTLTLTEV